MGNVSKNHLKVVPWKVTPIFFQQILGFFSISFEPLCKNDLQFLKLDRHPPNPYKYIMWGRETESVVGKFFVKSNLKSQVFPFFPVSLPSSETPVAQENQTRQLACFRWISYKNSEKSSIAGGTSLKTLDHFKPTVQPPPPNKIFPHIAGDKSHGWNFKTNPSVAWKILSTKHRVSPILSPQKPLKKNKKAKEIQQPEVFLKKTGVSRAFFKPQAIA